ncbi:MAG TPA: hypothetical protein VE621_09565, partial [Bryobacteraceae bacterium]|nr:hypothetical protein [Bryobacteraceae bacterium]
LKWRDASTPDETALVEAALKQYQEHFQPELRSAPNIATLTVKGEDLLVAHWTPQGTEAFYSELILWDTPRETSFLFRLPP